MNNIWLEDFCNLYGEKYEEIEGLNNFEEYDADKEVDMVRGLDFEAVLNKASYLMWERCEDIDLYWDDDYYYEF